MIIDSSALLAVLLSEPEGTRIDIAIINAPECRMSAPNLLEASMVALARKGPVAVQDLDLLVSRFRIQIVPFNESHARWARIAFERYGKGRHRAALNFGDCMAYALAKEAGEEVLFIGTDFGQTDIGVAPY
ncbi:MAG TPA: type II toxin-antitoxin system VapC family toxin [Bryobacteraceae bacterium]|nr:type II toxin-antitoxin system VapC family toxin [Bryobacteraceae bacterium]